MIVIAENFGKWTLNQDYKPFFKTRPGCQHNFWWNTGGPWIVQILCSQGIITIAKTY